jgi:N-acetyltransferase
VASEPEQAACLEGRLVRLEPLRPDDAEELFASVSDPEVWRWKLVAQPRSVEELRELIGSVLTGPRRWSFAVRRRIDGRAIGSTTLGRFDWPNRCVENGFTWLERASWGQGFNEDMKLAVLGHLFDDLGFERVEWQCDGLNVRSAAALERLGFVLEGTHRSRHVRPDGTRRDSLMFSLLRDEWPAVRARIESALADRADPTLMAPPNRFGT